MKNTKTIACLHSTVALCLVFSLFHQQQKKYILAFLKGKARLFVNSVSAEISITLTRDPALWKKNKVVSKVIENVSDPERQSCMANHSQCN